MPFKCAWSTFSVWCIWRFDKWMFNFWPPCLLDALTLMNLFLLTVHRDIHRGGSQVCEDHSPSSQPAAQGHLHPGNEGKDEWQSTGPGCSSTGIEVTFVFFVNFKSVFIIGPALDCKYSLLHILIFKVRKLAINLQFSPLDKMIIITLRTTFRPSWRSNRLNSSLLSSSSNRW